MRKRRTRLKTLRKEEENGKHAYPGVSLSNVVGLYVLMHESSLISAHYFVFMSSLLHAKESDKYMLGSIQ